MSTSFPDWLAWACASSSSTYLCLGKRSRANNLGFSRKNLKTIGRLAFPKPLNRGGPSPFIKILIILSGIIASSLINNRVSLALLVGLALSFALMWNARPLSLLPRLGPPVLLFGLILPLPALLVPAGSGEPLRFWFFQIYPGGLSSALTLSLRTTAAICWAGAGSLTEEPHALLSALPLPSVFAEMILGAHRYISLLAREAWEMFLGRLARDPKEDFKTNLCFLASRAGSLFARSAETGEKVYIAMKARGYPGLNQRRFGWHFALGDMVWFAVFLLALAVILWVS
ncbi:MAG: energy-coupling factor transporter transmembrane component T [candidate division WOR-3 bacterium]